MPTPRLSPTILEVLPSTVRRPGYDRASVTRGVVHLGIGAFHRAHQAVVFDDAMAAGDTRWGITGVSLRSPGVRDQLVPQGGLYTLSVRDSGAISDRVIGAVGDVLFAPDDPAAVIAAIAAPDTHIVSLTVTEKGYVIDPGASAADLARTAPGFIAAGLAERRARGLGGLTMLSCDNLSDNGAKLAAAVASVAEPDLAEWIAQTCTFPATMIDRIVPATTPDDIAAFEGRAGVRDLGLVKAEPFLQWVIEDRFAGERPDFAAHGVQLTRDVAPWEEAKLRLLNGAHSAIAYLGGLAGIEFVDGVVARPEGRAFVEALWDEAAATLDPPPGLDLAAYRGALMARFANSALAHRTRQIAMDGSQKLPQRLLASIAARLDAGQSAEALTTGVAAWVRWVSGTDDAGQPITVDDPLAGRIAEALAGGGDRVDALLGLEAIFPRRLADDPRFVALLRDRLAMLDDGGASRLLRLS